MLVLPNPFCEWKLKLQEYECGFKSFTREDGLFAVCVSPDRTTTVSLFVEHARQTISVRAEDAFAAADTLIRVLVGDEKSLATKAHPGFWWHWTPINQGYALGNAVLIRSKKMDRYCPAYEGVFLANGGDFNLDVAAFVVADHWFWADGKDRHELVQHNRVQETGLKSRSKSLVK